MADVRDDGATLSRQQASAAVGGLGWRYVLGAVRTFVRAGSPEEAADVAARALAACGEGVASASVDIRPDRVVVTLQSPALPAVTQLEIAAARRISAAMRQIGVQTDPGVGAPEARSVQAVEISIDALDIALVRPFWKAVFAYADEPGGSGPEGALVDAIAQGPAIWFQQMDAPRPQRNRIHFDVAVPHDEASRRIEAALAAGGVLVSDAEAPAFWVLADAEGNEVCITTWQGRDG